MSDFPFPDPWVQDNLRDGVVIPAHPLALTGQRKLDDKRQRLLTTYYHAAGAGGLAVGVHSTQFEIRQHGLYQPVLRLAIERLRELDVNTGRKTVTIAGVVGKTEQAVSEAHLAASLGYQIGMLSLGAMKEAGDDELIAHCRRVAQEIPLFGFYLQPLAGGRILPFTFWRRFVEIPNLMAIKIAPFNRYQTVDVMRAVAESGRAGEIALYTGNDDHIVLDMLTEYRFQTTFGEVSVRIVGGLLGQWACWTKRAVEMLEGIKTFRRKREVPASYLSLAEQLTDANAAIFDAANQFAGCIPGVHEVLRRQGLMENILCLDAALKLSPGQSQDIDRVCQAYPHLIDDDFVRENLQAWQV